MTTNYITALKNANLNSATKYTILFLIALAIPTVYIFATDHIWEDFFITFKHSKNLVDGFGLVYMPGEKVHGFTSPINTLLLSLTYFLTGSDGYEGAIALYRTISVIFYALGLTAFIYFIDRHTKLDLIAKIFLFLILALEIKTVVYTSNGQEAAYLLLFTLLLAVIVRYEPHRWILIGALCAGLQYTRPDGLIYFSSILIANFILATDKKQFLFYLIPRYAFVCTLLYLPWFITAWSYYGSPIPNTVTAKAAYVSPKNLDVFTLITEFLSTVPQVFTAIYKPIYSHFGGWPVSYTGFSFVLGTFAFIYCLLPVKDNFTKYFSLCFVFMCLYLAYIKLNAYVFPWYLPPTALVGLVTFVSGVSTVIHKIPLKSQYRDILRYGIYLIFLFLSVSLFFDTMTQMRLQQQLVENGNRKIIGEWLAKNGKADESVMLESLGYIGYFSGKKMYDYPGLVSPEMTNVILQYGPRQYKAYIRELKPDWLVFRAANARVLNPDKEYYPVKLFSVKDKIDTLKASRANVKGLGYLMADSEYVVYKRK